MQTKPMVQEADLRCGFKGSKKTKSQEGSWRRQRKIYEKSKTMFALWLENVFLRLHLGKKDEAKDVKEEAYLRRGFLLVLACGMVFGSIVTLLHPYASVLPLGVGGLLIGYEIWRFINAIIKKET